MLGYEKKGVKQKQHFHDFAHLLYFADSVYTHKKGEGISGTSPLRKKQNDAFCRKTLRKDGNERAKTKE